MIRNFFTGKKSVSEWIADGCLGLIVLTGVCDVIRHVMLGAWVPVITMLLIQICFFLIAAIARKGHQPWWMAIPCAAAIVLFFYMNNIGTTLYNSGLLVTAAANGIWAVVGTALLFMKKDHIKRFPIKEGCALLIVVCAFLAVWGVSYQQARNRQGHASREIWGVPAQWDQQAEVPQGTVEELFYDTHAYATDGRAVTKSVLVYLPAGYDESKQYNILYLMHGTGDDQYYWLRANPYNKVMLDNLIAAGEIEPLIVVTPTFYCEDDCKESLTALEKLTYAFKDELRNDLMPTVEAKYATYAESADEAGFAASRDHRAFAGLSRGAVTTYRSVFCGCLDYFASFGTFSGSRTDAAYFKEHLQSEVFAKYPINYLYVSTGNFDFAMPQQLMDYHALLAAEPRLTEGSNTNFDIFPMRYHSMGDWHLALYNFLQKIF